MAGNAFRHHTGYDNLCGIYYLHVHHTAGISVLPTDLLRYGSDQCRADLYSENCMEKNSPASPAQ